MARAGEPVTLVLDREIDVSRGDVLAAAPLPELAEQIEARVVWMDETPLFRGRAYQVMLGTQSVIGTVTDITNRLDIDTLEEVPVRELHMNEIGRVSLSLSQPVACEPYNDSRELGGFILIDRLTRNTVGAGMVTALRGARENVYWHQLDVDKAARAALNAQKPSVLWFTGLSGAGKSTIANLVEKRLHAVGPPHHDPGRRQRPPRAEPRPGLHRGRPRGEHPPRRRGREAVRRSRADRAGVVHLALPRRAHAGARGGGGRTSSWRSSSIRRWTNAAGAIRRGCTGAPTPARLRNFTGVDAPYEAPLDPEIRLRTLELAPEALAEQVVQELQRRGIVG